MEPQTNLKSLPLLCDIKINPTHSNHLGLWTELSTQNSHVEAQTPNVTVFEEPRRKKLWLNEVKKVGPGYGRISILIRKDARELTFFVPTARW